MGFINGQTAQKGARHVLSIGVWEDTFIHHTPQVALWLALFGALALSVQSFGEGTVPSRRYLQAQTFPASGSLGIFFLSEIFVCSI